MHILKLVTFISYLKDICVTFGGRGQFLIVPLHDNNIDWYTCMCLCRGVTR